MTDLLHNLNNEAARIYGETKSTFEEARRASVGDWFYYALNSDKRHIAENVRKDAMAVADRELPGDGRHNGRNDALRHAYAAAIFAKRVKDQSLKDGQDFAGAAKAGLKHAGIATTAHEFLPYEPKYLDGRGYRGIGDSQTAAEKQWICITTKLDCKFLKIILMRMKKNCLPV